MSNTFSKRRQRKRSDIDTLEWSNSEKERVKKKKIRINLRNNSYCSERILEVP